MTPGSLDCINIIAADGEDDDGPLKQELELVECSSAVRKLFHKYEIVRFSI